MEIQDTEIAGVKQIFPKKFSDSRGFFSELFKENQYSFTKTNFVQDNLSSSVQNTLRGMHYSHQAKLVMVIKGSVFDVVVDMRKDSPTYKRWQGFMLNDQDFNQIYIPRGCAHGFYVKSKEAVFLYKVSDYYDPSKEKEFRWNDQTIGISWPCTDPILSQRDMSSPFFSEELCSSGL